MPRDKIKPPTEPKVELMDQISRILIYKPNAVAYLLNFFSSADLVVIRDELRGKK